MVIKIKSWIYRGVPLQPPNLRGGKTPYSEARVFPAGNCVASSPLNPFDGTHLLPSHPGTA